jgi:2-keto-4-pentenoate hydratase/2-oxohepta-3-ene-1,7-dioic acid hydratase in catechol pathway
VRIIRFLDDGGSERHGCRHADGSATLIEGDIYGDYLDSGRAATVSKLLSPVHPTDVLCIGLNYEEHAKEGGKALPERPLLFMKTSSSVNHPGDPIVLPRHLRSDKVDYECELVVVIGKRCLNATKGNALDHVLGYTCGNDVSARDWQREWGDGQWCRGKTFATFAPIGPCLTTTDEITDPDNLNIKTILNGDVMQNHNTCDMIFDVRTLIESLSGSTVLEPGTVIFTGTPQGVGVARTPPVFLKDGDSVTIEIDNIGALTNPVVDES